MGHEGCSGVKASFRGLACHRGKRIPRAGRQEDKRVASITKVIDASRRSPLDEVESQSWQIPREEQYWIEPSWRDSGNIGCVWKWRVRKPIM